MPSFLLTIETKYYIMIVIYHLEVIAMGFFDNIGNKIQEGANALGAKTKDFTETAKLNSQINEDTKAITAKFTEIGKAMFEKYADDQSNEFAQAFADIKALEAKIAEAKATIQKIKGVKTCANCGAEIDASTSFCSACGAKVETAVEAAPAEAAPAADVFCSNCGSKEKAGTKFCSACGNQIG